MSRFLYFVICLIITFSCKQDLCKFKSQSESSGIRVLVDWSQSNIDQSKINNLSIYAYPEDGGAPYLKVSGDIESAYINLPAGIYSLLIFNDIVGDISGLSFRDIDSFDESYVLANEQSDSSGLYYNVASDETLISSQDVLAVWRLEEFEVTQNMVSCVYCGEVHSEEVVVDVEPTPITTQCVITIRIENLNNAQIIQGVLKGFASGAYLASSDRISSSESVNIYSVEFNSRTYDDSEYIDGTVEAEITTFGKEPDLEQSYEIDISVVLSNGELVTFTRDVTEQVVSQDNLKITINIDSQENMIVLPEGSGTGFGVEGWGDNESIDLM